MGGSVGNGTNNFSYCSALTVAEVVCAVLTVKRWNVVRLQPADMYQINDEQAVPVIVFDVNEGNTIKINEIIAVNACNF